MDQPDFESKWYQEMLPKWVKTETVLGGTDAMKAAGSMYLPQHEAESQTCYLERLNTNVLLNRAEDILGFWTSRPFSKELDLTNLSPEFVELADDIDKRGNNLTVFTRKVFREGLAKGIAYILVDSPQYNEDRSLIDRKEGDRPYWVFIPPENVIYKRYNDVGRINYLAVRETVSIPYGFGEYETQVIKIWQPGIVTTYQIDPETEDKEKQEWIKVDEITFDLDEVPIREFRACDGKNPPLLDVVELNITHWQSNSDQRNILTVSRFPILAASGTSDGGGKIEVGPRTFLHTTDPQGKYYYVEHNGTAITHGRQDLVDLEEKMNHYGTEFMKKRPSRETATARKMDSDEATSPLQDAVIRFNDFLNEVVYLTALWYNAKDFGEVKVYSAFGSGMVTDNDLMILKELNKEGRITTKALLNEMKNRGSLSEEFDINSVVENPVVPGDEAPVIN